MSDETDKWYLSGPLAIRAKGASEELISFEEPNGNTKWHINQNLSGNKPGLNFVETGVADGRLFIGAGGNIGIGTTNPTHPLHVKTNWGFLALDSNATGQDAGLRLMEGGAVKWHLFNSARDSKFYLIRDGLNASLTIDQNGLVGIGTTNPTHPLHVKTNWGFLALDSNATGQDSGLRLMEGGAVKWHIWNSANDTNFYLARDGLPATLAIDKAGNLSINNDIAIGNKHAFRGNDTWLRLNQDGAFVSGVHTPGVFAPMSLNVGGVEGWANPGNGNVTIAGLIGNRGYSPQPRTPGWGGGIHTWDVEAEGSIWCAHEIHGSNMDLAENYFSDMALEAGDVVSFDPSNDKIILSRHPADQFTCGVISTTPGFVLNSDPKDQSGKKYPLALVGRVPCKVTDENGPIKRGDLLCSSSTPGYAMRAVAIIVNGVSIHQTGTIIGKALGALESGSGVIDIFVSLS